MSELDAVSRAGDLPATTTSLFLNLRSLGVADGSVILVHSSLSSLGWVCGGEAAVVDALLAAVGDTGTVVVPTHTSHLSEPSLWQNPPVPEPWWPVIRESMPAFDKHRTSSRGVGRIPEALRAVPGACRSSHPTQSFAAHGKRASEICAKQSLEDGFGSDSPLGALYTANADVLLLGVGFDRCTSLHLAERLAFGTGQATVQTGSPLVMHGKRTWVRYSEPRWNDDDFEELGRAFERDSESVRTGKVASAEARLMPQRLLVDYAVEWLKLHRLPDGRHFIR